MDAEKPGGLRIVSAGFSKCFEDELLFHVFDGLMIFGDLHTGYGLLFQQVFR